MSKDAKNPIYWSFSGPDSGRMAVVQSSSAFVADVELMAELEKRAQPVEFGIDQVLFQRGEAPKGVYIVRKGIVTLTSQPHGDAILSVQAGPGSLLGVPAVIGDKPYTLTATVAPGAEVGRVSCKDFVHLMQTEPSLAFHVLKVLAEEVRFARESLSHL